MSDSDPCRAVLVPTELKVKEDASVSYAYAYLYAAEDYEKLKSGQTVDQGLSIAYKVFSLDLSNATSATHFQELVRKRIASMNVSMDGSTAKSLVRVGLDKDAVDSWLKCQLAQPKSKDGPVLMATITTATPTAAVVRIEYRSGISVKAPHKLSVTLVDCTFNDGETTRSEEIEGADRRIFTIKKGNAGRGVLSAECNGGLDDLTIDFEHEAQKSQGLNGDKITFFRSAGIDSNVPYPIWTPVAQTVIGPARCSWVASGAVMLELAVEAFSITFDMKQRFRMYPAESPGFDGFVISGFDKRIAKMDIDKGNSTLDFDKVTYDEDRVLLDLRGESKAGTSFTLNFAFK